MSDKDKAIATDEEIAIDSISNYVYALRNLIYSLEDLKRMGKKTCVSVSMALGEFGDREGNKFQIQLFITGKEESYIEAQQVKVA